jgi:hypothetical protein
LEQELKVSTNGKVGIQESSSESDMEIEFASDDISDGDAECLFCTELLSKDNMTKKGLNL